MAKLDVLTEEQVGILAKVGINPEGYGLDYMDDQKIILKHFKTGFTVWIRKEGIKSW